MSQRRSIKHPNNAAPLREDDLGSDETNTTRRRVLTSTVSVTSAIGAGFAAWPFIASWRPSAKARALGGPVQVKLARIEPGEQITVTWRGQPAWILRRTPEMLERMQHEHWLSQLRDPDSSVEAQQPPYAQNATRSLRPELFVCVALCTHLGCVPLFRPEVAVDNEVVAGNLGDDWMGGYYCPCHSSKFDLAGRVTKNVPAPTNLVVPPHRFFGEDLLEIGVDYA